MLDGASVGLDTGRTKPNTFTEAQLVVPLHKKTPRRRKRKRSGGHYYSSRGKGMTTFIGAHMTDSTVLESIVRGLIDQCARRAPAAPTADSKDTVVMLDMHVEGVRCLLVRTLKARGKVLSPRESQIVRLAAQGHPNKVIAGMLNISSWTVGTHIRHIFAKLSVTSRTAMVATVLETGLGEIAAAFN